MMKKHQIVFSLILLLALLLSLIYVFRLNQEAGVVFAINLFVISIAYFIFEYFRKKRIQKLSRQLRRVLTGDLSIPIQDYEEGELAVLSADIYKIIVAFKEQSKVLFSDKQWLADSLSDISHQLRTPITSMLMLTDLLKKDLEPERKKLFLQQLSNQVERLQWLVKNLLTLSKLDAQAIIYHPKTHQADELIKLAAEPLLISMDLKNQELKLSGNLGMTLEVDGNWLAEALGNLIKNASEHGPQQTAIQLDVKDLPMNKIISVSNQGSIPTAEQAKLFTRFYRGKNAAPDSVGIGLAIAQAIVRQQGGQIDLRSVDNQTTFSIRFPK